MCCCKTRECAWVYSFFGAQFHISASIHIPIIHNWDEDMVYAPIWCSKLRLFFLFVHWTCPLTSTWWLHSFGIFVRWHCLWPQWEKKKKKEIKLNEIEVEMGMVCAWKHVNGLKILIYILAFDFEWILLQYSTLCREHMARDSWGPISIIKWMMCSSNRAYRYTSIITVIVLGNSPLFYHLWTSKRNETKLKHWNHYQMLNVTLIPIEYFLNEWIIWNKQWVKMMYCSVNRKSLLWKTIRWYRKWTECNLPRLLSLFLILFMTISRP